MNNFLRHCWHSPKGVSQFDNGEHDMCCWCDIARFGYAKTTGHGPYYKGQGDFIDRTDHLCTERRVNNDDFTSYGR